MYGGNELKFPDRNQMKELTQQCRKGAFLQLFRTLKEEICEKVAGNACCASDKLIIASMLYGGRNFVI